jgi:hypothetical protein
MVAETLLLVLVQLAAMLLVEALKAGIWLTGLYVVLKKLSYY